VSDPNYARLAGRILTRYAPPGPVAPPSASARASAIDAIERAMEMQDRRQRAATRWSAVALVVAMAIFVATGPWRRLLRVGGAPREPDLVSAPSRASPVMAFPLGGEASVWEAGARIPLHDGGRLLAGSRIQTPPNGHVALAFASGTSAMLGENADLTMNGDDAKQVLRLDAGSVELHVAKVSADRRFLVATPDAEVEVRGTKFRVVVGAPAPSCAENGLTRITVTEGVVVVRHAGSESRVAAGQEWPGGCRSPADGAAPIAASAGIGAGARSPASTPASAQGLGSSLGDQNDLFAEAIVTKRHGDGAGSLARFDRFLATYPSSPLAQSAAVERMRLLRAMASPRAIAAARQYLDRYPDGFARGEAEAIVDGAR
jgi:ferric-dicitrate binding protein FerR (iron transport regulator)